MSRFFTIKPKETKKLLEAAKPVITVFSAISNLQKKIAEKEKNIKSGKAKPEEIKELKTELKKTEQEFKKMGKKKIPIVRIECPRTRQVETTLTTNYLFFKKS